MKKLLCTVLSFIIAFLCFSAAVFAEDTVDSVITDDVTITFDYEYNEETSTLTLVGEGDYPAFEEVAPWSDYEVKNIVVAEGITSLPDEIFLYMQDVETVTLPATLVKIGDRAFYYCENLKELTLPKALKNIGTLAFYNTGLASVTIPETVETIGNFAFGYCQKDDIENVAVSGFTIYGNGSYSCALPYAEENGIKFVDVAPYQPNVYYAYADKVAITLFWHGIKDVDSYKILRKTETTDYTEIATVNDTENTVYSDFDVVAGETYTYKILSVKGDFTSGDVKTNTVKFKKLATPKLESAVFQKDGINVKWDFVDNAEGYILYRRVDGGKWKRIAEFTGNVTSYLDKTAPSGSVSTYTVKAYSEDIESGYDYDGVSAVFLSVPELNSISNTAKGIKITWTKVKGANSYIIGRKTGSTGWTKITTVKDVDFYIDTTAKNGTTYSYTVVPSNGEINGFYDEAGLTYKRLTHTTVKGVTSTATGAKITWSTNSKCSGYLVYRKTAGGWVKIAKVTGADKSSYVDKTAKSGTTYTYTVKAYIGSYYSSYDSGRKILYLSAPKLTKAIAQSGKITVTFGKVSGAESYNIYRKTSGGNWKKIGTTASGSYTDKTAKKGTTYYYTVRAVNGSYMSSYNSNGLKVKAK
ncbi:MAG: leucine-rich repeat protein [Oscillospiraceae bacterium]|nr:leucine-rich repeat protein [Oscillospiraceae bacterium]